MKTYIYQDEKSHKFWAVEQQGNELHINWGKVGTNGQSQVKSFADAATAEKAELKLIAEKVKKGYVKSTDDINMLITVPTTADDSEQHPIITDVDTPPWIADLEPIILETKRVFSSRKFPADSVRTFAKDISLWSLLWENKYEEYYFLAQLQHFDVSDCRPEWQRGRDEAIMRVQQKNIDGSIFSNAFFLLVKFLMQDSDSANDLFDYLAQQHGVEYATELVLLLQQIQISDDQNQDPGNCEALDKCLLYVRMGYNFFTKNCVPTLILSNTISEQRFEFGFSTVDFHLRNHLSRIDEKTWQRCMKKLTQALPSLSPRKRPLIGFLLPEQPEIANQIVFDLVQCANYPEMEWLDIVATDPQALNELMNLNQLKRYNDWQTAEKCTATLLRERGVKALPLLQPWIKDSYSVKNLITQVNHPDAINILIKEECISEVEHATNLHPKAALYALTKALNYTNNSHYYRLLQRIILGNAQALHKTLPWLDEKQQQILFSYFPQLMSIEKIAHKNELPSILIAPSWLEKKKKIAGINLTLRVLPLPPLESIPATKNLTEPSAPSPSAKDILDLLNFHCEELGWGIPQAAIDFFEQNNYEALLKIWDKPRWASHILVNVSVLLQLSENKALKIWNALTHLHLINACEVVEYYGLPTLPGLLRRALVVPQEAIPLAARFGATEVAPLMARAFRQLKSVRDVAERWLLTYPEHAITGLLPSVLGKAGSEREDAATAIRYLAHHGHQPLMEEIAHRYNQAEVLTGLLDVLNSDPLDNFPQKIAKLPAWCTPEVWHRPLLRSNGKALPDSAILQLCTMLSFPREATLYPGITQVIEACTPQSLADFAWDLFLSWEIASGSAKDNWAFTALGILGNDDTARKLTPLIRAWPGESQHKRATVGLDILAAIGSDIALMQLNGIAQKLKFKALQDQARTKIAQIAESRQLTVAEMEDRLAPDLGLDDNGSLLLDFGPRLFTVSFDESLKPFVREASGNRLKDLPKPNKSDDETLAEEAVNRYKLLKKDVRTVAAQQISRLEAAMCQRRRWTAEQFRLFLVEHPLVRHITQRLMWGIYDADNQLISCFRVAEDGSFSDGQDNPLTLAQGSIGIPHVLEIPAPQAAEFAQLFSAYELLPPFSQLDRPWSQLSETEKSSSDLQRWAGRQAASGRVAGLMNKGWQRGDVLDGGGYYSFYKAVDDGYVELSVTPGFCVGLPVTEISDSQKIEHIQLCKLTPRKSVYPFSVLDDITASELINDIESLFD
ncbi:DUF4132 domain-containing protein [Escherichia coli]|uniref:DUF4132 domain-containing protein n=1 Tax=Escherichia coli TaxID=562 RepID=UPI001C91B391|nr:WGR and DUF4132 domain-containing protein [Escherichia coli]MBY3717603.1 WGR and DUF4132 domain-containing protein [Escherichia coli]